MKPFTAKKHYLIAFWTTLVISIGLIISGVCTPPYAEVDGSILESVGLLFLWPALAFGNKALEEGKTAKISKGDLEVKIGDKDEI
jgi:hypothetical protein